MEKINIAELLKDCPKGMELDCTMYNKVTLLSVDNSEDTLFPIKVLREDGCSILLTKYGQYANTDFAKCIIFPKGKTTWEGFEPYKFKVGDKAFAFGNKCTITDAVRDEGIDEIVYTIKLDTSKYTTTKLSNQLQLYKEETMEEIKIDIPKGYEFAGVDDDNQQVVFTRMLAEYPKTYEECCKVMNYCCNPVATKTTHKEELIRRFQLLLLYRDAYWKIAGEEMGLGKPWKPDYTNTGEKKFSIWVDFSEIKTGGPFTTTQMVLSFPTEEMRDAFKENFDKDLEFCKELL